MAGRLEPVLRAVAHACRLGLALVLLYAAWLKSLDPEGFTREVVQYGILDGGLARFFAYFLIWAEIAIGTALLLDYKRVAALAVASGLMIVFAGAIVFALATGQQLESCGCFGSSVPRTPQQTLVEDMGFLAAGLFAIFVFARSRKAPARVAGKRTGGLGWKGAALAVVALASGAFVVASPHLPIDDFATSLRPGVEWAELDVALAEADLTKGRHLVALLDVRGEATFSALEALNDLAAAGEPAVVGLYSDDESAYNEFFWMRGPGFPVYYLASSDMNRLHRRLPRYFAVSDGVVRATWSEVPSREEISRALED